MGKNCNPSYYHQHAWWGGLNEQVKWANDEGVQFFGHEVHLPRLRDIPVNDFLLGMNMRHPLSRMFSLYLESTIRYFLTHSLTHSFTASLVHRINSTRNAFPTAAPTSLIGKVAMSLQPPAKPAFYLQNFKDYMRTAAYEQDLAMLVGVEDSAAAIKFPNPRYFKVRSSFVSYCSLTHSLTRYCSCTIPNTTPSATSRMLNLSWSSFHTWLFWRESHGWPP